MGVIGDRKEKRVYQTQLMDDYFDAGEVVILRTYFGLKPRKGDPPIASLYDGDGNSLCAQDGKVGPIRLWEFDPLDDSITPLSNAVARICLGGIQDQLPQWATFDTDGNETLGRAEFRREERKSPLVPHRLLCINWADSGPGFSWPEAYHVTCLPGFDRCVVTVSSDSTDSYGVSDFAIGSFRQCDDLTAKSQRIVFSWWQKWARLDGGPWAYLFSDGLIDEATAEKMRDRVWKTYRNKADDEDRTD